MKNKDAQFLYLTTTGWKSGQAHEIEIWYVEHEGRYYLCAEMRENAHWVKNIRQQPSVTFWVNGTSSAGSGRILEAEADAALLAQVSALFDTKYGWSSGLLVELSAGGE